MGYLEIVIFDTRRPTDITYSGGKVLQSCKLRCRLLHPNGRNIDHVASMRYNPRQLHRKHKMIWQYWNRSKIIYEIQLRSNRHLQILIVQCISFWKCYNQMTCQQLFQESHRWHLICNLKDRHQYNDHSNTMNLFQEANNEHHHNFPNELLRKGYLKHTICILNGSLEFKLSRAKGIHPYLSKKAQEVQLNPTKPNFAFSQNLKT